MKFSNNYEPTAEELQEARDHVGQKTRDNAAAILRGEWGYADHCNTPKHWEGFAAKEIQLADQIEAGELDHNFTIWQSINYFLTGECPGLLP